MKRIFIPLLAIYAVPALSDVTILNNGEHSIAAKAFEGYYEFTIEFLKDYTNETNRKYPDADFPHLWADVDANGKKDAGRDLYYAIHPNATSNLACVGYVNEDTSTQPCGSFNSKAKVFSYFNKTPNNPMPHVIFKFLIPNNEIQQNPQQLLRLSFDLYSAKKGYARYPNGEFNNFESMFSVKIPAN